MRQEFGSVIVFAMIAIVASAALAQQLTREQIIEMTMKPYDGPTSPGVDPLTMHGKVLCGYQGWFAAEGDGLSRGFYHWGKGGVFHPGHTTVDLWPDVSELDPDERYPTAFRHADGRVAEVFSSYNRKTVVRHFKWMQDYGIDGAFIQRFGVETMRLKGIQHKTAMLGHAREGANLHGRTYAVMYDLSGLDHGQFRNVIEDWKLLVGRMQITKDPAYLHHRGRPVVAVWGLGFKDRKYTLDEGIELVRFLKDDPQYGGCTVMLGIPTYWRTLDQDCIPDPKLHEVIMLADVISPWTVGRYRTPEQAREYFADTVPGDIEWCREKGIDFIPVVFPGFSWHNLKPHTPLGGIPRLGGRFLWAQYASAKQAGATMVYQAMFDEVDEGTAIFKCTNDPPVGESKFLTYEGLPSDHYLKLVGEATRMIRGERELTEEMPEF